MVKKTLSKTVKHAEGNIYSLICKGAASTGLKKSVPLNVDLNYSLPDILPPKRRKIDAATKPTASLHNNDANDSCDSTESVEFSSCQPKSSPVNNNIGRSILPATYFDSDTNSPNLENNCSRQSLEHLLKTSDSSISTCSDSMQDHTAPKKRGRPKKINSIEKENFDSSPSSSNLHNCTAELVERSVATSVKYRSRTRKLCNQTSQIPSKCESTCVLSSDKPESKLEISRSETKFVSDGDELPDILPPTRHRNVGRSLIKTKKQHAVANLVFSTSDSESTHSSAKCIATCSDGKQDHAAPKKRGRHKKIKNSSYEKETFGDSASSSNLDNCSREISKPKSTCVLSSDESESKVKIAINETKLVTDCDRLPNMLPSSRRQNVRYNLSKTKKQRAVANLGFPTSDSESTQSSVKCIAACSDSKQDHAAPKKRGRPKKIKNSSYEKETFDSSAISSISDNCSRELVESSISETKLTADCEELPDILPPTRRQNIGRNFTKTKKQPSSRRQNVRYNLSKTKKQRAVANLGFPTSDSESTQSSVKCIAACSDSKQDHAAPKKRGRPKKIKNSSYEKETFASSAISSSSDNCSRELVESSISETKLNADCEELPDILPPTRPQNIGRNFTKTKKQLTAVNLSFPTSDSEHTHSSAKCINDDDSLRCQQKVSESSSASHDGNSILDRSSVNDLLQRTTVDSPISIDSEEDFPQPMLSPRKKIVLKTRFPKPRAVKKAPVRSGALFGEKSFKSKASSSGCKTVSKTADNNDDLVYSSSSIVPYTPVSNTTMELDTSDELPDLNDTGSPQSTEVGLNKTGMWEKIFGDGSWKTGKSSSTTCEKAVKTTKGKCTRKSAVTNVDAKRPKAAKSKSLSLKKGNKTRKYGESSILHHLILNKSADVQNTGQIVTCEYKEVKVKTRAEISKMFELPKVEYTYEEPKIVLDSRLKEFKRIFSKVDENDIKQKIEANLPYLRRVSDGRVKTWRHGQYTKSGRDRRNLDYQYPMYLLNETQQDAIYLGILKIYCNEKNGMENFDYLMRVLIPEFIVKVFMDICSLSHDVADTLIRKQDSHMAWADYAVPE